TTSRFGVVYFSVKAFILGRTVGVKYSVWISLLYSLETRELRCHCVKVFSHGISIGSIASVDFIPEGPHCIRPEVMKDGKQFCLNTTMPWVQRVIQRFTKKEKVVCG
uniref:Chemokine interleukin-8-like domain-containing protein n=1 Tax=Pseudonaja textilis TaxID=8673 RepID=A0A670ZJB4_PSETE